MCAPAPKNSMIPWFQFTVVHLGPIPIQVWGFFVALGMVVSLLLLQNKTNNNPAQKKILDSAFWIIIWGFIGARLGHIIFYEPQYFLSNPIDIFKIWQGGMSSFGSFLGAGLSFFYYFKKNKFNVRELGDTFLLVSLPGWMIGRVGCFMIHDHLGAHSTCPLAIMTPDGPRLDMALLEILGLIPLAIWVYFSRKKKFASGTVSMIILAYYSALRLILDFWRATDIANSDARYSGLTPAQYFSIIILLFAGWHFLKLRRK